MGLVEAVQSREVEVGPVEDIERAGLDPQAIEEVDVGDAARREEAHRGEVAPEVQQGGELDGPLPLPERGPGKQGEAEIDRRGVEGVHRRGQLEPKGVGRVEWAGGGDESLCEVGVDPPVAHLVGMGEGVARDHAPEPHVVELGLGHPQAGLNISQALPERELGKGQAEELIPAGEGLDLVLALVPLHADAELVRGDAVHQLGEDRPATVHGPAPLAKMREYGPRQVDYSNR